MAQNGDEWKSGCNERIKNIVNLKPIKHKSISKCMDIKRFWAEISSKRQTIYTYEACKSYISK